MQAMALGGTVEEGWGEGMMDVQRENQGFEEEDNFFFVVVVIFVIL